MMTTTSYLFALVIYWLAAGVGCRLLYVMVFRHLSPMWSGASTGLVAGLLLVPSYAATDADTLAPALITGLFNLLFAGGITLAKGFVSSGLSSQVGDLLASLALVPTLLAIVVVAVLVTALTEATSNTATTALLMPILAAASLAAKIDPMILMVPAAMSASCAFMLPVATPPNAIVFGSGKLTIPDMIKAGFALNVIGVFLVTIFAFYLAPMIF